MGMPFARVGDLHLCPMVTPGLPPVPHVGGPILPPGRMADATGHGGSIAFGLTTVLVG
jgi:uncharacterized Zn-binding protein involved in type VI secretion